MAEHIGRDVLRLFAAMCVLAILAYGCTRGIGTEGLWTGALVVLLSIAPAWHLGIIQAFHIVIAEVSDELSVRRLRKVCLALCLPLATAGAVGHLLATVDWVASSAVLAINGLCVVFALKLRVEGKLQLPGRTIRLVD